MKLTRVVRRLHLWAGVFLGLQILLWMASGVVMSWYHIDLVRGERNAPAAAPVELETTAYASPGGVIAQQDGVYSLELRTFMGRPVYETRGVAGAALFDAQTGERLSPLKEDVARTLMKNEFIGDGEIEDLSLLDHPPQEYRGPKPVWRASFNDKLHTRLYLSPETGRVVSRRNDIWRIYDFFWMLHIMDYSERENFNNPLLKAASALGLMFSATGLAMIFLPQGRKQIASDVAWLFGKRAN